MPKNATGFDGSGGFSQCDPYPYPQPTLPVTRAGYPNPCPSLVDAFQLNAIRRFDQSPFEESSDAELVDDGLEALSEEKTDTSTLRKGVGGLRRGFFWLHFLYLAKGVWERVADLPCGADMAACTRGGLRKSRTILW